MLGNEEDKERRKTVAFTVELDRSNGPLGKSYNSFSKKGISYDKKKRCLPSKCLASIKSLLIYTIIQAAFQGDGNHRKEYNVFIFIFQV